MNKLENIDTEGLRRFGLLISAVAIGLFGLFLPWVFSLPYPLWPWIAGGGLMAWALIWPAGLRPIYVGWMRVGHGLGWVNTSLILALVFYLIITPIGLLKRLFGKDSIIREWDEDMSSYRIESSSPPPNQVERTF